MYCTSTVAIVYFRCGGFVWFNWYHETIVSFSSIQSLKYSTVLNHRGWVTHICVSKLIIIDSNIGLSPDRRQAIIGTNIGVLLTGPLGANFSEFFIEIHTFSFKKNAFENVVCDTAAILFVDRSAVIADWWWYTHTHTLIRALTSRSRA